MERTAWSRMVSAALLRGAACFFLALLTAAPAAAQPVDELEAHAVAAAWLNEVASSPISSTVLSAHETPATIQRLEELVHEERLIGWVAHLEPDGYIVVSAARQLPPIKAYSLSHGFVHGQGLAEVLVYELGRGLEALDRAMPRRQMRSAAKHELGPRNQEAWARLLAASSQDAGPGRASRERRQATQLSTVGPLVTANWGQRAPFNLLCPYACDRETPAGCVAIAVAQVMHFWKHPAHGYGSHTYEWDGGGCEPRPLSASFEDRYDWLLMPDFPTSGSSYDEQMAVAELVYEVGVAFESTYSASSTGALVARAVTVLPTYFGYSSDIDREDRLDYDSDEQWFEIIRADLDQGRPLLVALRGTNPNYPGDLRRHAVVADGYQISGDQQLIHLNMGWTGWYDDWFTLNGIETNYTTWDVEEEHLVVRNIAPDPCRSPASPANLEVIGDPENGYALRWSPVERADHYEIERSSGAIGGAKTLLTSKAPGLELGGERQAGEDRFYRVRVVDMCGIVPLVSHWSQALELRLEPPARDHRPTPPAPRQGCTL